MRNLKAMTTMELLNCLCTAEMTLGAVIAHNPNCVFSNAPEYVAASEDAARLRVELSLRIEGLA